MNWISDLWSYATKTLKDSFSLWLCSLFGVIGCIFFFSDPSGYLEVHGVLRYLDHTLAKLALVFLLCFIVTAITILIASKSFKFLQSLRSEFIEDKEKKAIENFNQKRLFEEFEMLWQCLGEGAKLELYKMSNKEGPIIIRKPMYGIYLDSRIDGELFDRLVNECCIFIRKHLPNQQIAIELTPAFRNWLKQQSLDNLE